MFFLCYLLGEKNKVPNVAINTTVIELTGIKIAAMSGDNCPEIAKLRPMMLQSKEKEKQMNKIRFEKRLIFNKLDKVCNLSAAKIASDDGEN